MARINKLLLKAIKLNVVKHLVLLLLIPVTAIMCISCNDSKKDSITNADNAKVVELEHKKLWANQDGDSTGFYSFYRIGAIKVDDQNNIYVVDSGNNRIMKYDENGIYVRQIGKAGQGPGELLQPSDLDFDKQGFIYVTNKGNDRIEIFTPDGLYFNSFKVQPSIHSYRQASIAVGSNSEIFLNTPNSGYLITIYSANGKKLKEFGTIKQFDTPLETYLLNTGTMEFDREENVLYFVYTGRPIFKKYNQRGKLLKSKIVDGEEVRKAYEAWERNKKNANPGTVGWMIFFYDVALIPNNFLLASTEIGPVFYLFNSDGEIVKKYKPRKRKEHVILGVLACKSDYTVLSGDTYNSYIFSFHVPN